MHHVSKIIFNNDIYFNEMESVINMNQNQFNLRKYKG